MEFSHFQQRVLPTSIAPFQIKLLNALAQHYQPALHGDEPAWQQALNDLPALAVHNITLNANCPRISGPCDEITRSQLRDALMQLHPWRKGPFNVFDVVIDSEWRSDWKWQRLIQHISPLAGRSILDVGCGNGYYLLRMLGEGAAYALGIDPTLRFIYQFEALRHYLGDIAADMLPLKSEDLPRPIGGFDTVFSMGVLYHRKEPLEHLIELRDALAPGGELVLETLVLPAGSDGVLVPADRYAQMRNVWAIPSVSVLEQWVRDAGFTAVRTVDITTTTVDEQRATDWMTFQSLADFLDPIDPSRTIEGHPAPVRAIVVAQRPCEA
ncbi:MAG TPA: tRNA 5-methoxyuridine(34)/uridine 5-oxyacetic acid(34) synthase CmoB [Pseudomonadales bacterium]|jgi:tRNA (mo5U34)-methyltransferase